MEKNILITGASKGIGKAIALKFADMGYNIFITYLTSKNDALSLKEDIEKKYKVKCYVIKCDISNELDIKNMVSEITNYCKKIDVLINNASLSIDNYYEEKNKEEFLKVLEVNVVGTYLVTKYVMNIMKNGYIINISSKDAKDTYRDIAMDYCASKAAINSLCQTFSIANISNKFISIMLPWVNTESVREMFSEYLFNELKKVSQERLVEPNEVADKIYKIIVEDKYKSGSILDYYEV